MWRFNLIIGIVMLCIIGTTPVLGQEIRENDVPVEIREDFSSKYPDTYVYKWKRDKKTGEYKAKFYHKGIKYKSYYNFDLSWKKTERDVQKGEVPQSVWMDIAKSKYYAWEVDDVEEHSTPEYPIVYEIEVKLKEKGYKNKIYLYYLPDGTFVKEVVKK